MRVSEKLAYVLPPMRSCRPISAGFGNQYRAIRLLIVFEDGDDRAADGNGRAVERVHELRAFFAFYFVANIQPADW